MQVCEFDLVMGRITVAVIDAGQCIIEVTADPDTAQEYMATKRKPINRLLRLIALQEYRRMYR